MKNADKPVHPQFAHLSSSENDTFLSEHMTESGVAFHGLTKRELIAAMAMQGLCSNSIPGSQHVPENLAAEAIQYADELLKQLES